jgi:hypothetical protein
MSLEGSSAVDGEITLGLDYIYRLAHSTVRGLFGFAVAQLYPESSIILASIFVPKFNFSIMAWLLVSFLVASQCILAAALPNPVVSNTATKQCRTIPGDPDWPARDAWAALNRTVKGNLVQNIPIGSPCHKTYNGQKNPLYNEKDCQSLRDVWFLPETHLASASSPMAYLSTNNSCNPFADTSANSPCTQGGYASYSIDAKTYQDLREGVLFATKHNIRLVIRNTGHDYLGRSTGAHSLALWTHNLKSTELIQRYNGRGSSYKGPALKLGAGVHAIDAYEFAQKHGLMVAGGNCPTVGLAGGWTQGGGHGPLSSKHGLGADQVLEWQVLTVDGRLITVSAAENADLHWALRGGGGGTYGIVISVTIKAFPSTQFSTAYLTVPRNETNSDLLFSAVGDFMKRLPVLVEAGLFVLWLVTPDAFMLLPAMAPGLDTKELDQLLQPTLSVLDGTGLGYQYSSSSSPDFLTAYNSLQGSWNVSDLNTGGRLVSLETLENNPEGLLEAVKYIGSNALFSAVSYNLDFDRDNSTSVNPYMRKSIFNAFIGVPINYQDWPATKSSQNAITNDLLLPLKKLDPRGGAYLNEADVQEPEFQSVFYGSNYQRLLKIKKKYDPQDVLYAKTAIGSDGWSEGGNGRLCRVRA